MKPEKDEEQRKEDRRKRELELVRQSRGEPAPFEIIGWLNNPGDGRSLPPHRQAIRRGFWKFLHDPAHFKDFQSVEEKAERVASYEALLHEAEVADRKNDKRTLKRVSDAVRQLVAEIPADIPPGGFDDVDHFIYKGALTVEEIRSRLISDLDARGLLDWFHKARADREAEMRAKIQ
jgi:hypothetical protein